MGCFQVLVNLCKVLDTGECSDCQKHHGHKKGTRASNDGRTCGDVFGVTVQANEDLLHHAQSMQKAVNSSE